ncbi:hypothetical protein B0A55_04588 [Friedmanniomyces simplex]|uniref:Carbohydrate kinase PfkB domain-containing protein n=1 Tax=Friedmanniomyces simplex TaxID=329884 RepID=A0A4V5NJL9_9PEZI|nr:hypothetical protein B0A55_04588 [Friedmanniomyces simplex]
MDNTDEENLPWIDFVTLGMFIIDDIYPPASALSQIPQKDIIGGAGTYSALGARLFSPPPTCSKTIAWIIDAGTDFPAPVRAQIEFWQTSALIRPRKALTTRGWNGYGENEYRAFRYLTEKKRLIVEDLTPDGLLASTNALTSVSISSSRSLIAGGTGSDLGICVWLARSTSAGSSGALLDAGPPEGIGVVPSECSKVAAEEAMSSRRDVAASSLWMSVVSGLSAAMVTGVEVLLRPPTLAMLGGWDMMLDEGSMEYMRK